MKQQTAVEWLVEELQKADYIPKDSSIMDFVIDQAKAMEQDQIQDAFYFGVDVDSFNVINPYKEAEKYYQKTFVNENV
jgi:3-mercaptopyruvate sulfurtransferase SseA